MSFEPNDMNTIHLGNYEEFFILYMDNELSETQVKMVDEFLMAHPDLRSEFEILMSTKLPFEKFSFDKKDLFAESIKLSSVDEELLLYIDEELTPDKKQTVELELAANKGYQLQHQVLLQTKLDPLEKIVYPDKKELYRRTERVIPVKVWMRVAAAVVIIAIGGIVYFKNPPSINPSTDSQGTAVINKPVQPNKVKANEQANSAKTPSESQIKTDIAVRNENTGKDKNQFEVVNTKDKKETTLIEKKLIAVATPQEKDDETSERTRVSIVQLETNEKASVSSKDNINTGSVTSLDPNRKPFNEPDEPIAQTDNDRKGSLKGFLRKATRVIEKRTGIDPTNSNGELLIGAVAINLK